MRRPRRTQFRSSEAGGHRNRPWGNASSGREAQDDETIAVCSSPFVDGPRSLGLRPLYDNDHDLYIDDGYHIICQEPKERTHESKPGAGGGKSRAGRRGSWPAVPREGIRGHRGRRTGRSAAARREKALATMSGMVGAMVLARAVNDPEFSAEILRAGAKAFGSDAARMSGWRRAGVWAKIMSALAGAHDAAVQMIDTSIVRVHQHGACVTRNRRQSMGRSRGGLTSKIHAVVDTNG